MQERPIVNHDSPQYTLATAMLIIAAGFIALCIVAGIFLDTLGLRIDPWGVLLSGVLIIAATAMWLYKRRAGIIGFNPGEWLGCLLIVGVVSGYMVAPALPGLLPPSRHFDATHHLVLAKFIFENNSLPHDPTGNTPPYFMTGYPAGGVLFAALVGHWSGASVLFTLHPVIALVLGLSAGITFVLICRLLPSEHLSPPIAFLAVALLFTAWDYFPGAVNERYIYSQTFAQFFALGVFLLAFLYFQSPRLWLLIAATLLLAALLITHPVPIVAPTLVMYALVLFHPQTTWRQKGLQFTLLTIGLLAVLALYVAPLWKQWLFLTRHGESIDLNFETLGVALPFLGILGAGLALQSRWRTTFWFPFAILAGAMTQPIAVFILKWFFSEIGEYQFQKSVYLLIYPMSMFAVLPLVLIMRRFQASMRGALLHATTWGAALGITFFLLALFPPRPFVPVTRSELAVAEWAKQNLPAEDIAVTSPIYESAYWIDLLVFGESPVSRKAARDYFMGSMTYAEWRGNPGAPDYALVRSLARTPADSTVKTIHRVAESALLYKPRAAIPPPPAPQHVTALKFGEMFNFIGYDAPKTITPSEPFWLTFYWQPLAWHIHRQIMFVQIIDPLGNVITRAEDNMFQNKFPTQRWSLGLVVSDPWKFTFDADTLPGDYAIEIAIVDASSGNHLPISRQNEKPTDKVILGSLRVRVPPPTTDEVRTARPMDTRFGDTIALRGYTFNSIAVHRGAPLRFNLYWECLAPVTRDLTVFVHLIDVADQIRAQIDVSPQNGTYPTNVWQPGEIIKDPYRLAIPPDLPPGEYRLKIGLYTPTDLKRLTTGNSDHIILAESIRVK